MDPDSNTKLVVNQHYDESLEVNDAEEVPSYYSPTPRQTPPGERHKLPIGKPGNEMGDLRSDLHSSLDSSAVTPPLVPYPLKDGVPAIAKPSLAGKLNLDPNNSYTDEETDDSETSTDDDEDNMMGLEGAYDPGDYEHLQVNQEIKELFQYITRYTPQTIELEHKLKPFNPEYIPAVGDIDAFLKVPRPDSQQVSLGFTVLDEPCSKQSDPTVLDLQLRNISKTSGVKAIQVRSVKEADRNPKAIDTWIESIEDLHRSKPPPTVHYTKSMPDIDSLMTEWPKEIESMLANLKLPTADLDCKLKEYVDIICSILDIPVYKSRIQSLHLLFSVFSAFKQLQHFQNDTPVQVDEEQRGKQEPQVLNFE